MTIYSDADVVIIGTGPLALIKGLYLSQAGRQVTFIDSSGVVGGSWKSLSCLGFENVEVGVHLIENRFRVNKWLRDQLGNQILDQGTQTDFGLVNGKRISISATRVLLHSLVTGKAILQGRLGTASRTFVSTSRAVSQFHAPFLYPESGFSLLIQTLVTQLQDYNVNFIFGVKVALASPRADGLLITLDCGEIKANQIEMFSRAHTPIEGMLELKEQIKTAQIYSLILLLSGPAITFNGYVEIIGDNLIKRIRNVGLFARPMPSGGKSLICVQLRQATNLNQDAAVFKRLLDIGLINHKVRLLDSFRDTVMLKTLTQAGAHLINNCFSPKINIHESTDFADCLDTQLKKDNY